MFLIGCPRVAPPSRQSPTELQKIQLKLPVQAPRHRSLLQWSPGILQVLNRLLSQLCDALEEWLDPLLGCRITSWTRLLERCTLLKYY